MVGMYCQLPGLSIIECQYFQYTVNIGHHADNYVAEEIMSSNNANPLLVVSIKTLLMAFNRRHLNIPNLHLLPSAWTGTRPKYYTSSLNTPTLTTRGSTVLDLFPSIRCRGYFTKRKSTRALSTQSTLYHVSPFHPSMLPPIICKYVCMMTLCGNNEKYLEGTLILVPLGHCCGLT